jgi:hypothetical protein
LWNKCSMRATASLLGTSAGDERAARRQLPSLAGGDSIVGCAIEAAHANLRGELAGVLYSPAYYIRRRIIFAGV